MVDHESTSVRIGENDSGARDLMRMRLLIMFCSMISTMDCSLDGFERIGYRTRWSGIEEFLSGSRLEDRMLLRDNRVKSAFGYQEWFNLPPYASFSPLKEQSVILETVRNNGQYSVLFHEFHFSPAKLTRTSLTVWLLSSFGHRVVLGAF